MFVKPRDVNLGRLSDFARKAIPAPEPKWNREAERVIPCCEPDLRGNESRYVAHAVDGGWISSQGAFVEQFEEEFADKVGAKYGCAVTNGTAALQLCLAALGVTRGDEVIMPSMTMIATANAASYMGAKPVLTDCDQNYCIDVAGMGAAITKNTKAIIPVHLLGHPVDMHTVSKVADARDIPVIYDAAEAHGAKRAGFPIGGGGLASTYSFFANKLITTGEGGMVVSNDEGFIELCCDLRDMAFSDSPMFPRFWHRHIGYNFRMTNMQAAIGCAQIERFDDLLAARIDNGDHYRDLLRGIPGVRFQPEATGVTSSRWMIGIEIDPTHTKRNRCSVRAKLAEAGIQTRTYFVPIHLQPCYYKESDPWLPNSERLSSVGLYLPSSSLLTNDDRRYVANKLKEILG